MMIKYLRWLVLGVIGVFLITVALANREPVTLNALPADIGQVALFNFSVEVPLFFVAFGGILIGLLIGFVWEWLRGHRHRAEAAARAREVSRLEKVVAVNAPQAAQSDEVLALLDKPRKAV